MATRQQDSVRNIFGSGLRCLKKCWPVSSKHSSLTGGTWIGCFIGLSLSSGFLLLESLEHLFFSLQLRYTFNNFTRTVRNWNEFAFPGKQKSNFKGQTTPNTLLYQMIQPLVADLPTSFLNFPICEKIFPRFSDLRKYVSPISWFLEKKFPDFPIFGKSFSNFRFWKIGKPG